MAQFHLYANANPVTRSTYPFLLDVQAPLLESLETRLVIPLCSAGRFQEKQIKHLTPLVTVGGEAFLVLTPQMAAIGKKGLGAEVTDLSASRTDIISAIDFLITGL